MTLVVYDIEVEHRAVAVGQFAHETVEHVGIAAAQGEGDARKKDKTIQNQ